MNFGQAIDAVKDGQRVQRNGWNGKGMFIYLNKGSHDFERKPVSEGGVNTIGGVGTGLFDKGDTGTVTRMPNLNMRAADGSTVTGWLASQTDILADDWQVEGPAA